MIMDFIIKKMNSLINISEKNTVEMQTYLRERIEYIFYLVLGCLWNENFNNVAFEKRAEIVENLNRMSIGEVVAAIRTLDINHKYVSKKDLKIFDKYPALRNKTIGHGYVHNDHEPILEKDLDSLYNDLSQIKFISQTYDIVCVRNDEDNRYTGVRFDIDSGGLPEKWACPKETLDDNLPLPSVFLFDENRNYYRITPFVCIEDKGESIYVFQSLADKLSGNVKMSQLFRSGIEEFRFQELISISYESERRRISTNGTIMNYFDKNYSMFIDTSIENEVNKFLNPNSRSNVQATIWGHGGVGKTACIQNICFKKFDDQYREFSYIIFASAKERRYDPFTGEIIEIDNLRSYEEIINMIIAVVFDEDGEDDLQTKEDKIYKTISSRVLLIIDDYETFPDEEKKKIQSFINNLNIDYFKVIITTRNKRLSTGVEIPLDEFEVEETQKFLLCIFQNEYPEHINSIKLIMEDAKAMNAIQQATSGRAIFLYQFANIFVQKGFDINYLKELKDSKNAQDFLYGKIYSYLSECAKKAFVCISQIAEEKNLIFKERIIEYLLNEFNPEELSGAIQELIDQKIIEPYGEDNYRIYTKELFFLMQENYDRVDSTFKDKIKNKIQDIGGTNISGTVYEAMLNEANQCRTLGNVKLVVEKYKHLLNEKKCERNVKKKALINLTSYMSINLLDLDGVLQIFDEYVKICNFQNDVDILKLYTQYLWSSDVSGKEKACDILERYFRDKKHKKTALQNLELFAMAVSYCSTNTMENTPEKVKISAEQRIFNEYGRELYNYVVDKNFSEFRPSIKHNISLALIQSAKLALDLRESGHSRDEYVRGIIKFGNVNFNDLFIKQLKKIQYEFENGEYKVGAIVRAEVTYIAQYGVLVNIAHIKKAIIHNTELPFGVKKKLKKGDTVFAKVLEKEEKGYRLSMKDL